MRDVNDRVVATLREEGRSTGVFVCECEFPDCDGTIQMPLVDYESLGSDRAPLVGHPPDRVPGRTGQDEGAGPRR